MMQRSWCSGCKRLWTIGCGSWAKDVSACTANSNFAANFLTGTFLSAMKVPVEDDKFYRRKSVEECMSHIFTATQFTTKSYLESKASTIISNNVQYKVVSQSDLDQSVIVLAFVTPTFCGANETGQVFELAGTGF